jgi:hypothetical protein
VGFCLLRGCISLPLLLSFPFILFLGGTVDIQSLFIIHSFTHTREIKMYFHRSLLLIFIASHFWTLASSQIDERATGKAGKDLDVVYLTVYECLDPGAGPFTVVPGVGTIPAGRQGVLEAHPTSPVISSGGSGKSPQGGGGAQQTSPSDSGHGGLSGADVNLKSNQPCTTLDSFIGHSLISTSWSPLFTSSISQTTQTWTLSRSISTNTDTSVSRSFESAPFAPGQTTTPSTTASAATTSSTTYPMVTNPDQIQNALADGSFANGLGKWGGTGEVTVEQHGFPQSNDTGNALLTARSSAPGKLRSRQAVGVPATISQKVLNFPPLGIAAIYLYYAIDITAQPAGSSPQDCKLDVSFGSTLLVSTGYFPATGEPYRGLTSRPLLLVGGGSLSISVNCINGATVAVRVDEIVFGLVGSIPPPTPVGTTSTTLSTSRTATSSTTSTKSSTITDTSTSPSTTYTTLAPVITASCTIAPFAQQQTMSPSPQCGISAMYPAAIPTVSFFRSLLLASLTMLTQIQGYCFASRYVPGMCREMF